MTTATAPQEAARSRIVTVGGGKGGVGKSIIALNLAATLAKQGQRVVIADMDLGAANQHLLLGVDHPRAGLQALLNRSVEEAQDCLTPTEVPNLRLLAGTGGVLGAANIKHSEKVRLLQKLRALEADIVVVDVGAGVGYNALDFFDLGSRKLLVTTPQVTAIHDAYSFLKSAVLRLLHHCADQAIEAALLEPATLSAGTEKVVEILARLRDIRPALADKVFTELGRFGACMVGNQVVNSAHTGVFRGVAQTIRVYLGLDVPVLACLRSSNVIYESVNRRRPLALGARGEDAAAFQDLAKALMATMPKDDFDLDITEDEAPEPEAARPAPPIAVQSAAPAPATAPPRAEASPRRPAAAPPPLPGDGRPTAKVAREKSARIPKEHSRTRSDPNLPALRQPR